MASGAGYGAGYELRRALGIAVFSGMLGVTVFGLLLTPEVLRRDPPDHHPQEEKTIGQRKTGTGVGTCGLNRLNRAARS